MMDKAIRAKLNDERLAIEKIFQAFSALHHAAQEDYTLSAEKRDEYLDTIRGQNPWILSQRYKEIQDLQWQDFTGRPVPGGEPHLSVPDAIVPAQ